MVIDKIKDICEQRSLTITELGRLIGLKKSSIYSIINNGNPTVETLEKIAKALNVSIRDFFDEDKEVFTCPHCHQVIRDKDFFPKVKAQE